jgi:osmotically-inducible protein OsmY
MKSDRLIKHEVLCELKWDTHVDETEISVEVDNGTVTLTGSVKHYGQKIAAQDAVHRIDGVQDVINEIHVTLPEHLARTDHDIALMVRRVLEWDVRVPEERITCTVSDGWVTLEGQVDVWRQREDAEHAVRHLACVRGVNNLIRVRPQAVPSTAIERAVHEALERRAQLEADRINIHIDNGVVTLSGHVGTWKEKLAIIEAVSHAPGVETVKDEIQVAAYI